MRDRDPELFGYLKALTHELVGACGGTEPAAVILGVSHQRVSQLQNPGHADLPTLMQVAALEQFAGRAVVSHALADLRAPESNTGDLARETRDVTYAAVDLQRAVDDGESCHAALRTRAARLRRELDEVETLLAPPRAA